MNKLVGAQERFMVNYKGMNYGLNVKNDCVTQKVSLFMYWDKKNIIIILKTIDKK